MHCGFVTPWVPHHLTDESFSWLHSHLLGTSQERASQKCFHPSQGKLASGGKKASFADYFLTHLPTLAAIFHKKGSKSFGRIFRKTWWLALNLETQ
jgi:hypothetical protein